MGFLIPINGTGVVTNAAGANVVTKSDGANLVASRITDDGTSVASPTRNFDLGDRGGAGLDYLAFFTTPDLGQGIGQKLDIIGASADTTKFFQITGQANNFGGQVDIFADGTTVFLSGATASIDLFVPSTGTINFDTSGATGTISANSAAGTFQAGDVSGAANGTALFVTDADQTIALSADPVTGVINLNASAVALGTPILKANATVTAGGTTGAQTINKSAGSVNFGVGASSLVVTNSTVTADSIIIAKQLRAVNGFAAPERGKPS